MPKDYEILSNDLIAKPKDDSVRLFFFDVDKEELISEDFSNDDIETLYGLIRHPFDNGFYVVDRLTGLNRYESNSSPTWFHGKIFDLVVLECAISEELFERLNICCANAESKGRIIFGPGGRVITNES